jgi:hypothetical protein
MQFGMYFLLFAILMPDMLACSIPLRSFSGQASARISGEMFPVLYNNCYGGFGYSVKAIEEYNKRLPAGSTKINVDVGSGPFSRAYHDGTKQEDGSDMKFVWHIERGDPLMVQVCSQLGDEANGEYAKIAVQQVPRKFEKHYFIGEYDGLEKVQIDFPRYQLDKIKSIVTDDSISSEVKVKMTQDTLLEEDIVGADVRTDD